MRKSYKYSAVINKTTEHNAERWLDLCRFLYNCALRERIDVYQDGRRRHGAELVKSCGKKVSYFSQAMELKGLRTWMPEYDGINVQMLQTVLDRLDKAYAAFYRRLTTGSDKAGFPRFKGKGRYDSFTMKSNGWKLEGRDLWITNVGRFKLRRDRPVQGDIKTVTVRRESTGKWFVCFSCDNVPETRLPASELEVGIDVGIKNFCVDSTGRVVDNPKYLRQAERELRIRQRRLSRRVQGSGRRKKARLQVARAHDDVKNQRSDFLHKLSTEYVRSYGAIFVEDLEIKNMVKNHHLAKSISDAGWGTFTQYLSYKAEEASRKVVKVNPRNTSQNCSGCGEKVEKSLAVRIHNCPYCSLVMDRDENAARNILQVGQACQAVT